MNNFSEIQNKLKTGEETLIQQYHVSTGLPIENVKKLYESFETNINFQYGNDINSDEKMKKINESFTEFLNSGVKLFDFEGFQKEIEQIAEKFVDPKVTTEERSQLLDAFNTIVYKYCEFTPDIITLFEIICFVLLKLNKSKFEPIANQLQFGLKSSELFESINPVVYSNIEKLGISKLNTSSDNVINSEANSKLYGTLKNVLGRNNKRWGNNYHLDSAYTTIMQYLDAEINDITLNNNIQTVNDTFELDLLKQIIQSKQIPQEYRYVDVLRKLIPDLQTLVFDCMVLTNTFIQGNAWVIEYLNRNTYIDYLESTKRLYAELSSSYLSSKIIDRTVKTIESPNQPDYESSFELDKLTVNYDLLGLNNYRLQIKSVVDMLHIIKSCETEFNLKLRKILNLYVTKTFNLLAPYEHIMMESRKSNKFKNGY